MQRTFITSLALVAALGLGACAQTSDRAASADPLTRDSAPKANAGSAGTASAQSPSASPKDNNASSEAVTKNR